MYVHTYKVCSNLLEPCERVGIGTNRVFLSLTHALVQLPANIALPRQCPHLPPSHCRVMAPSRCLAWAQFTQLGHMHMHTCSLIAVLRKGLLDGRISLTHSPQRVPTNPVLTPRAQSICRILLWSPLVAACCSPVPSKLLGPASWASSALGCELP